MTYRSIESAIRGIVSEERLSEAALGDYKGLMALAKRKSGDEQSAMMSAADMMKKGQIKDLNMFMKAMDKSTHKAMMPFVDKKYYKALHEGIEQLDEADPTGLKIYHKEKDGKEGHAIVFTARDAQRRHNELKKAGTPPTHHALMYGTKEGPKKPIKEELDLDFLDEKKLTPAELKKREEVAQAIERETPNMPMDKKMAIATATAKRVAEQAEDDMPASPDEKSMAMQQLKFIEYAAKEIADHIDGGGRYPEWMQNKLTKANQMMQGLHANIDHDEDEDEEDMMEARGADVEDRHIIMQLRSAQDLGGNKEIRFRNKTSAKVAPKHIDKILKLHDHPAIKPVQKRLLRVAISKSPQHLANFADKLKEDYDADNMDSVLNEAVKVTDAQIHKVLGPTKNAQQGIEALKKAFKVKDNEAKAMLDRVMPKEETSLDEAQYKVPSNYAAMMQKKKKADAGQQMSDDEKKKNITPSDRDRLSKLASMLKKEDVQEATDKEVKMATGIAFDKRYKGHNMTGATKAIEKIRKGLSDHPRVKSALRQANEDTQVEEKETGDHVKTSDFKMSKVRLPDGRMVYRKVKREIKV